MPKIIDHIAYRKHILDACLSILAEKGYAYPMRKIATTVGVSTGTLYHYFPNKLALFEQLSEHIARKNIDKTVARISNEPSRSKRAEILVDTLVEDSDELTALVLLSIDYARLVPHHKKSEFFTSFLQTYAEYLSDLLQIPEEISYLILSAADGILLHNWINPDVLSLQQRLDVLRDMVLSYLAQSAGVAEV